MFSPSEITEKTAVIESKSYSIRVVLNGSVTMYAARDILTACGIKDPGKWIRRNKDFGPTDITMEKVVYPLMTNSGYRHIPMFFMAAASAKKVVSLTARNGETKKWLLKDVLTYQIKVPEEAPLGGATPSAPAVTEEQTPAVVSAPVYDADLNRRIDKILLELLEIKRCVAGVAS